VFGLGIHPTLISFSFSFGQGPSFDFAFAVHVIVQNSNIHNMVILLPWFPNMSRRTTIFAYLNAKPVFVVQMSVKQPFNHISVGASIDLAFPPRLFVNPIYIFHYMIWW
jgi:hypothetical protein